MTRAAAVPVVPFPHRHLLGIEGLSADEISLLLDLSETYVAQNRQADKKRALLRGRTLINLFFESSTRTRTSLRAGRQAARRRRHQHAGREQRHQEGRDADRHGADAQRHASRRAGRAPSRKRRGPAARRKRSTARSSTPATAATSIRPRRCSTRSPSAGASGALSRITVAICGDIQHSRVARSNIHLLNIMGARVRAVGPPTLVPQRDRAARRRGLPRHGEGPRATPTS